MIIIIITISLILYAGGEDCLCSPLDENIWQYYAMNVNSPPPMFDSHFYSACNDMTTARFNIDLHQNITHSNWLRVYKFLVNDM